MKQPVALFFVALGLLYAVLLLAVKWQFFPGYSWPGYLGDLKGLAAFAIIVFPVPAALLWFYAGKEPQETAAAVFARFASWNALPYMVALLSVAASGVAIALFYAGEADFDRTLLQHALDSDWPSASAELDRLKKLPLRPELVDTLDYYVKVFSSSDNDQLSRRKENRANRIAVRQLLDRGVDIHQLNLLTYVELSKAIAVREKNGELLSQASLLLIREVAKARTNRDLSNILFKIGDLELTARHLVEARQLFNAALELEDRPAKQGEIRERIGTSWVDEADSVQVKPLEESIKYYKVADQNYPEGRRYKLYSNWCYVEYRLGHLKDAVDLCKRAIGNKPDDWYSYINLALAEEGLKKYDDALKHYNIVIQKSDNEDWRTEARIFHGYLLELTTGRVTSDAVAEYISAVHPDRTVTQTATLLTEPAELAKLYRDVSRWLQETGEFGMSYYVDWFNKRALGLSSATDN